MSPLIVLTYVLTSTIVLSLSLGVSSLVVARAPKR